MERAGTIIQAAMYRLPHACITPRIEVSIDRGPLGRNPFNNSARPRNRACGEIDQDFIVGFSGSTGAGWTPRSTLIRLSDKSLEFCQYGIFISFLWSNSREIGPRDLSPLQHPQPGAGRVFSTREHWCTGCASRSPAIIDAAVKASATCLYHDA